MSEAATQGLAHSLTVRHAAQAGVMQLPDLVYGEEDTLHADRAYWRNEDRESVASARGQGSCEQNLRVCAATRSNGTGGGAMNG
jgi:hypothetical protein